MNLFGWTIEKRADTSSVSDSDTSGVAVSDELRRFLGENTSLTREQALEIPSVGASIKLISDVISALPVNLFKTEKGEVKQIKGDRRCYLLNYDTGDTMTAPQFWRAMLEDYYLGKGAFAYINKRYEDVVSIHHVKCENISFLTNTDPIFKDYDICVNGKRYGKYEFIKLLRNTRDGHKSTPMQEQSGTMAAVAYNELRFEKSLVETGGGKKGYLCPDSVKDEATLNKIKSRLISLFSPNGDRVAVFSRGAEFHELSSTPTELQLNENKETNSAELTMLFSIANPIIRGNATQKDIDNFINFCIMPLIADIEASLDRDLLTELEKEQGYHFYFDVKELKRGNIKERYEAYEIAYKNNFLLVDEIREKEDLEPLGFEFVRLGLDSVLYNIKTGEIYTPNTNATTNMKNFKKGEKIADESGSES
ncbi:MAG: phage portal protein [Lachnospiraceae bacterium]|nr:phage portal protein [Lachnospiraceae bacterium]